MLDTLYFQSVAALNTVNSLEINLEFDREGFIQETDSQGFTSHFWLCTLAPLGKGRGWKVTVTI